VKRPTVILRACAEYDPDRIERIVREGLDALGLRPKGRVLVKPNVVASGKHFPHAHTRPEFVEGVLRALKARDGGIEELAVGERCGITIPTRFAFDQAGYYPMADRVGGVLMHHFDEVPQVEIPLYHQGRLRDSFYTPEPVARADFFVNCPKFKAHPWTTVTFSMKNYIGIQDDRHRLLDHDHKLEQKVSDLQYIVQPQLVAIDAITAGEGRMLTPLPFDLGMVIMGDNQVAVDAVCCRIIGIDPMAVPHIRMAWERGFGPLEAERIRVLGDVSVEEARERAAGFRSGLIRVEEYFQGTNIRAYGGRPPGGSDYCWGGCPGAMEEAIEIMRLFDAATDEKMPPVHIAFGSYNGHIDAKPGEKIFFIGDCAQFHGQVAGEEVDVRSLYVDRSRKDPLTATHEDIFTKMAKVGARMWMSRNKQVVRITGCPVSVAEHVLLLVNLAGLKNPYLDLEQALPFGNAYLSQRGRSTLQALLGVGYNRPGPAVRGRARPDQSLPPAGAETPLESK
jgi:uncharacterized protein (DUF362 family)